jgi:hypothetical protein
MLNRTKNLKRLVRGSHFPERRQSVAAIRGSHSEAEHLAELLIDEVESLALADLDLLAITRTPPVIC